jgi:uncharacterized protein
MSDTRTPPTTAATPEATVPWWRVGTAWLVMGGPATVVVAALFTAYIAISGADTLVDNVPQTKDATAATPAVQARNHAATPVKP